MAKTDVQVELVGTDSNAFMTIGIVKKAMKKGAVLVACVGLAALPACSGNGGEDVGACDAGQSVRVATFNIAMGLEKAGQLSHALAAGDDPRLEQVA